MPDSIHLTECELVRAEFASQICHALDGPLPSSDATKKDAAPYFGLQKIGPTFQPGFFVGMARLPNSEGPLLVVHPRFKTLDYAKMFATCCADPVVSRHLGATFFVWPEERPIEVEPAPSWFTPLLVISFLASLDDLCSRHLRRNYLRVVENLAGRIKGRIKVRDHVRQNLARQRPDRVSCEFGIFNEDCLENRILRAALEVAAAYAVRHSFLTENIHSWVRACRTALARVTVARIHPRDFQTARHVGSFRHYRNPHLLARAVLQHLGMDPENLSRSPKRMPVPPFALCTFELFERYAETILRKSDPYDLWTGYEENNLGDGRYRVRPDFIRPKAGVIVDCKYKFFPDRQVGDQERADAYQILAYSRHSEILQKISEAKGPERPKKLVLLYPDVDYGDPSQCGSETLDDAAAADGSFEIPLFQKRLYCPVLERGVPASEATTQK